MIMIEKIHCLLIWDFFLSKSKRIMKVFLGETNGLFISSLFHGNTDSMYIEKFYWDVLDKTSLVGSNLCESKNDYKSGGNFYCPFLAAIVEHCLTIDKFDIIEEQKNFKRFNDSKGLIDRFQYFSTIDGKKSITYVT